MEKENANSCLKGCLRILSRGFGILFMIALLLAGGYLVLRGAGAYLIVADALQPAQAIVMLSGGDESRMQEALSLYGENYGDVIVLTETGRTLEDSGSLYSNDIRIQLLNNGVPSGNILITDMQVGSTLDEAYAVKELLTNRQFTTAIIVTDPYHMRRMVLIFRNVFGESDINLIFRPVRGSWYTSRTWFLSADGWKYTVLEYLKLIGYYLGFKES
jgi:uncharacterized SAM-binding protein YcdF (DUF218 family)